MVEQRGGELLTKPIIQEPSGRREGKEKDLPQLPRAVLLNVLLEHAEMLPSRGRCEAVMDIRDVYSLLMSGSRPLELWVVIHQRVLQSREGFERAPVTRQGQRCAGGKSQLARDVCLLLHREECVNAELEGRCCYHFVPVLVAGSCSPPWGRDGGGPYGLSLEPGAGLRSA